LIADRLALAFPHARVLIVIREQKASIYSMYQQYVRNGGAARLEKYLAPRNPAEIPQFRFSHYEYHKLIEHYFQRFGRENVLVLPFEWLKINPDRFMQAIAAFVYVDQQLTVDSGRQYSSMNALIITTKRFYNLYFVRNSLNPAAPFYVKNHEQRFERFQRLVPYRWSKPFERRFRSHITSVVGERYALSNHKTSELIGVDLKELGYQVD
jgi:hypothetical protein